MHSLVRQQDPGKVHILSISPQSFQIVEFPGFLREHMDDQRAIVQQLPGVAAVAFTAQHLFAQLL